MPSSVLVIIVKPSPTFLECVLAGIERQSCRDFELVFFADGAPAEVVRYLEQRIGHLQNPARLVWPADIAASGDTSERLALRTVLQVSSADVLMVSDSQTILHDRWVEMHLRHSSPSRILTGTRVELSPDLSFELRSEQILNGWPKGSMSSLISDGVFGQSSGVSHAFFIENSRTQTALSANAQDVCASNFSLLRKDAVRLLPFLDSEMSPNARLLRQRLGMNIISFRNTFVQYRCHEPGTISLLRVAGILARVQGLRIPVPELGLRPAMHTTPPPL